jgi:hypothetical protein
VWEATWNAICEAQLGWLTEIQGIVLDAAIRPTPRLPRAPAADWGPSAGETFGERLSGQECGTTAEFSCSDPLKPSIDFVDRPAFITAQGDRPAQTCNELGMSGAQSTQFAELLNSQEFGPAMSADELFAALGIDGQEVAN